MNPCPTCTAMLRGITAIILLLMMNATGASGQSSVLTEHNDAVRSGLNPSELLLAPGNVKFQQFGKLFVHTVDGLIVGQPLVVPALNLPDGSTHDVVYVATQHDSVYAFDADDSRAGNSSPLWVTSFINPAAGITSVPIANFGCTGTGFTEVGVTGTPVIDLGTGTLYVVAKTLENGIYVFRLHALDLVTGQEKFGGPVVINASQGAVTFNAAVQMQRPALLLSNGTLYLAFGGNGCDTYKYRGWIMAYDASSLTQLGVFLTTPKAIGGSVWQSGGGLAADANGTIYFATANGLFDADSGGLDYGDSVLQLQLAGGTFSVVDYFTPFNQNVLRLNDLDLGSGGVMLLPDQGGAVTHEMVAGGKGGTVYLLDRDNMGQFNPAQDNVVQSLSATPGEIQSVPVYWNAAVYITGNADVVKMFALNNGLLSSSPVSQTSVSFNLPGSASLSANGATNGILWVIKKGTPILYAFDATNLANMLYASNQASGLRDQLGPVTHFATPTVVNGKVYVGGNLRLTTYGFLPKLSPVAGNNQTAVDGTVLPTPLQFQAMDSYTGAPLAGVAVTCRDGGVNGTFSNPNLVTDSSGLASTTYTLPKKAANITIQCSNPNFVAAVFTERSVPGPPVHLAIKSGNFQTAAVNTTLPLPLVVRISDVNFVAVPGITVSFNDSGANGVLNPVNSTTNSSGTASTSYTTPGVTGTVKVTASSAGLPSVKFTVTVQ